MLSSWFIKSHYSSKSLELSFLKNQSLSSRLVNSALRGLYGGWVSVGDCALRIIRYDGAVIVQNGLVARSRAAFDRRHEYPAGDRAILLVKAHTTTMASGRQLKVSGVAVIEAASPALANLLTHASPEMVTVWTMAVSSLAMRAVTDWSK